MLWVVFLAFLWPASGAFAQSGDLYQSSTRPMARVTMMSIYQRYLDDNAYVAQASFPFTAQLPLGRSATMTMMAHPVSATGQHLNTLSSFSDAQIALSYFRSLGGGSLVLSVSANLPTGKRELTSEEFETSVTVSQTAYNFRVPTSGQGFNVYPGLTLALPLSNTVVAGVGAAVQFKGGYKPTQGFEQNFEPGNEVVLTGGLDIRVGVAASLSTDASFTLYGKDKVGGAVVVNTGNKTVLSAQLLQNFGFDQLRITARYRSKARSDLPGIGSGRTVPNQTSFRILYRKSRSSGTAVRFLAQIRALTSTDSCFGLTGSSRCKSRTLVDLGVMPEWGLSRDLRFLTRAVYTVGDFTGVEVGGGFSYGF